MVDLVDMMAARYGKLPHEVLAMSAYEFNLAAACMFRADARTASALRKAGMVFPTFSMGGL